MGLHPSCPSSHCMSYCLSLLPSSLFSLSQRHGSTPHHSFPNTPQERRLLPTDPTWTSLWLGLILPLKQNLLDIQILLKLFFHLCSVPYSRALDGSLINFCMLILFLQPDCQLLEGNQPLFTSLNLSPCLVDCELGFD